MNNKKIIILCLVIILLNLLPTCFCIAQETTEKDSLNIFFKSFQEALKKIVSEKKSVKFGISLGWKELLVENEYYDLSDPYFSPADSLLHFDRINKTAFVLSAVISVFPFKNKETYKENVNDTGFKKLGKMIARNSGIIFNIDISKFAEDKILSIFNEPIEGGLGYVYSFDNNFAIGLTFEKAYRRVLRSYYYQKEGGKIFSHGDILTEFDKDNSNFFKDKYLNAYSIKAIVLF